MSERPSTNGHDAAELNEAGREHLQRADLQAAEKAFTAALERRPDYPSAWFNLGLVHKVRRDWPTCARCFRRYVELTGAGEDDPGWWNLGIAATALRAWETARRAWRAYGIEIQEGEGPIEENFGLTPVRLDPLGNPEVVWCLRIDPARAIVRSVPLPGSGHRWGDVVLHDGEPKGERDWQGRTYPVFDEIERWEASDLPTLRAEVFCATPADAQALTDLFGSVGLAAEDWTESVRMLCRACSEGRPHKTHDGRPASGWDPERQFGLAVPPGDAQGMLLLWADDHPNARRVLSVEEAF